MASFIYSIPSIATTVTRPVAIGIVKQVLALTGLDPTEYRTRMVGMSEQEKIQLGYLAEHSSLEELRDFKTKIDSAENRSSTDKVLTIEVEDEIMGDLITPIRYHDHKPIFVDPDLNVRIKPVYSDVQLNINVKLNVRDKVVAHNWIQEIKRRIYQSTFNYLHDVSYYYIIPHIITKGLYDIHRLRESNNGLNEDLGHYFKRCFDNRYDIVTNLAGNNHLTIIREKQVNIIGWFEWELEPSRPEKEDDNAGGWNISFTYTVRFNRPDNLVFEYPLMVHQRILPDYMIQKERTIHYYSWNTFRGLTDQFFDYIAVHGNKHGMMISDGIPDPLWDDWIPNGKPPRKTLQLSRTLIAVDDEDPHWVIDLTNYSDLFEFKPEMLRWFRKTQDTLFSFRDNIFYITLHSDTKEVDSSKLTIDEELRIRCCEPLDKRKMYHVVIYVLTDISHLSDKGWRDLWGNCDVFHEWVGAIYPGSGTERIRCNTDNTINEDDFRDWWNDVAPWTDDIEYPLPNGPGLPWSECVGSYCTTKPGWWPRDDGNDKDDPYGRKPRPPKTVDYKTFATFAIIARRLKDAAYYKR